MGVTMAAVMPRIGSGNMKNTFSLATTGTVLFGFFNGVNLDDLARIKMQIRASEIYAQDDISSLARTYGSGLTSGLTLEDIDAWPDVLAAVTPEDIMDAASRIFEKKNAVTGLAFPEGEEELLQ